MWAPDRTRRGSGDPTRCWRKSWTGGAWHRIGCPPSSRLSPSSCSWARRARVRRESRGDPDRRPHPRSMPSIWIPRIWASRRPETRRAGTLAFDRARRRAASRGGLGDERAALIAMSSGLGSKAGWALLLAAAYFVAAKLSLLLAIPPGYATAVWPPSGIALAALLLLGVRFWPGIWLGAALTHLTLHGSPLAALPIA